MARKNNKNKFKDSDADGLPDEVEKFFGTNPHNPDTDNDGVSDGDEVKLGRNPKGPGRLKDLFIPHAGNNFKPQALHHKRIIFYSLSAVLFKFILIGAVVLLPVEAWLTPDILIEQSKKIISLTNVIRKNLNLAALTESNLLDQASFNKAEDMLLNQYFAHTGPDNKTLADWLNGIKYNYAVAGENLAMGFSSPEDVINGWTRSQTHYRNMVDPDFKEIGVGLAAGPYNSYDTTFVAQYFAAPVSQPALAVSQPKIPLSQPAQVSKQMEPAAETQILGEKLDTEPPTLDQNKSRLYVDQPQGKTEKIVRANVYLSADATKARVNFNNYFIDLKPGAEPSAPWLGQTIIFKQDQKQIFNPVILATVTAEDRAGNIMTEDLKWENITPAATTMLKQYYFVKQHQPAYVKPLFEITSIYYKILLAIALIALALNIFIEIKKQHPHIILSTLGLIGLLIGLIIL